jgi:hypothetical protein
MSIDDPDAGLWLRYYDANDNLIFQDDPTPNRGLSFEYDALNRLTRRAWHAVDWEPWNGTWPIPPPLGPGTELATFEYDTAVNGKDRLARAMSQRGEEEFGAYDARGNVLQCSVPRVARHRGRPEIGSCRRASVSS